MKIKRHFNVFLFFFLVKDRHLLKLSGYCKSVRHFSPHKWAAGKGTDLQLLQVCVCIDGFVKPEPRIGLTAQPRVKAE